MSTSRNSRPRRSDGLGTRGEDAAAEWYRERGWEEVARNWRCRDGEIDLVVRRQGTVAIVEVKARSGVGYGMPAEAVTPLKAARLRRLAAQFLAGRDDLARSAVRFDVAEVMVRRGWKPVVDVLEDAF